MSAKHERGEAESPSETKGKLAQLLETESELDAMLQATRQEAELRVAAAREAAELRVHELEMELDAADRDLRGRVTADRDEAIAAIRADARRQVRELEQVEGERLDKLARFVLSCMLSAEIGGER
jgi:vacuolar-type H+-ATPase subunit H